MRAEDGIAGEHDATFVIGDRLVVTRSGMGPTRAVIWDAVANAWHDAGAGPITYRDGDTGPFSAPRFLPAGDFVVMLWRNDGQRPGVQGRLIDVRAARWDALPLEGGPSTDAIDGVDSAGRLVAFEDGSLGAGWRFDPRAGVWARVSTEGLPAIGGRPTIVALGDRVLALGTGPGGEGSVGALYDPEADRWTPIADGPTPEAGFVAARSDALFWWAFTDARHGALYDRGSDRWQTLGGGDAPTIRPTAPMPTWAFTGDYLVTTEDHPESRALPRDPAVVYDVRAQRWSRLPIAPTFGLAYALPDGRAVFFGHGSEPPVVVDPARGLVCTPDVSAVPTLHPAPSSYGFVGVIGDELVVWSRTDVLGGGPHCPPGAPCMVAPPSVTSTQDDGVAIRF